MLRTLYSSINKTIFSPEHTLRYNKTVICTFETIIIILRCVKVLPFQLPLKHIEVILHLLAKTIEVFSSMNYFRTIYSKYFNFINSVIKCCLIRKSSTYLENIDKTCIFHYCNSVCSISYKFIYRGKW